MQTNSAASSVSSNGSNSSAIYTPTPRPPPPPRSESMAYPPANPRSMWSKFQYYLRQNTRAVGATVAFFTFVIVITSDYLHDARANAIQGVTNLRGHKDWLFAGAHHAGYFSVQDSVTDQGFHFGMVTDLDQLSRIPEKSKPMFQSHLALGFLKKTGQVGDRTYEIQFNPNTPVRHLVTGHNEAGRGAEFSELSVFQNRLLTFDDRTGDVFEILNTANGQDSYCVPRLVITEGSGDTDKGMKWEWSTVKDDELYLGSMGKEYTDKDGNVENVNNLWIAVVDRHGKVRRENWSHVFLLVRRALGAEYPGYIIVEAVNWSPYLKKWVFMPRRISHEEYNDVKDEKRGGRQLVLVDPDFRQAPQVINLHMASADPLKGFSSFAFVPNTRDRHLLAIRSVEEDCALDDMAVCKQRSYLVVLDTMTGESLSPEVQYEQDWKFEGLEFFDPFVKPPITD